MRSQLLAATPTQPKVSQETPRPSPASAVPVFKLRAGVSEDAAAIAALQTGVDADVRLTSQEYIDTWRWLVDSNPTGIREVLVGTAPDGTIVAHEAMVSFIMVHNGKRSVAGLPCLLVVAEEYRRTALFLSLEMQILRQYAASGIDFLCGPVRARMLKPHMALGFRTVGSLPIYARPYRLQGVARHFLGAGAAFTLAQPMLRGAEGLLRFSYCSKIDGVEVTPLDTFDDEAAAEIEQIVDGLGLHALRTASILNWRYWGCPVRHYSVYVARQGSRVAGYVALRRMRMQEFDTLAIVDLVFAPNQPRVGKALLSVVHRLAIEAGVDMATCMLNPHSPLLPVLKRLGFLKTSEGFQIIAHWPKGVTPEIDQDTCRHWHYTWFEHDYV